MLRNRFPVLALAAALGCSDAAGPFGGLDIQIAVTPDTLIPFDSATVRIAVYNRSTRALHVDDEGCALSFEIKGLARPDPAAPRCIESGFRWDELAAGDVRDRERTLPAGDSLVVIRRWTGVDWAGAPLEAGWYRIRAILANPGFTRRGEAQSVAVLPWATLRLVHSVPAGPLDLVVTGRVAVRRLGPGEVSAVATVAAGPQVGKLHSSDDGVSLGRVTLALAARSAHVFAVRRVNRGHELWEVTDTSAVTDPTQSRLRVIHLAENAPDVDVFRTQPDFPTPVRIMFPFPYGGVSPYLLSDAGGWTVMVVTAVGRDTLLATSPIPIPGGETRTVILVDRPGGGIWATLLKPEG